MIETPLDTILHGDCLALLHSLPGNSIDVILTDPPYSSGTRREAAKGLRKSKMIRTQSRRQAEWFGSDSLTTNGFIWLMRACAVEWERILKPGGHALVFIDWRMMPALAGAIESADLRHSGLLVWDKTYFGMGVQFRNQHELILHFTKGVGSPARRRDVGNVIACAPVRNGVHPTEKPVELLRTLLSVVTPPEGVVLDCFGGSGSTAVAAIAEGAHFLLIEREAEWIAKAKTRVADARGEHSAVEPTKKPARVPKHRSMPHSNAEKPAGSLMSLKLFADDTLSA